MQPLTLLLAPALLAASTTGVAAQGEEMTLRLTYYHDRGITASGAQAGPGVAACSADLPFGTILRLPDGRRVTCQDRGLLHEPWLDVWVATPVEGRALAGQFGDYVNVVIERWGH